MLSGLGKGLVTCSVGKGLQVRGFDVSAVKCDPYINVDAGTMNPYIHGEVFVLDDGYEADMDLGTYERFLGIELTHLNNVTSGQVYQHVIKKEREGGYLGTCVQIIPHVTDEIKRCLRLVAEKTEAEVLLIECGGTVGDIEGLPFLEAFRQMRLEEPRGDTLLVHVDIAETFLPAIARAWAEAGIEMRCDQRSLAILEASEVAGLSLKPAQAEDFGKEFLAPIASVRVVDSLDAAIDHIYEHGTGHSDAIITEDYSTAMRFLDEVDTAVAYVNASTQFTDGAQFGLGAEIIDSTQKTIARGPVALREITTYKWIVLGSGQTRP